MINSNYGFLAFGGGNGYQYRNVIEALREKADTRQAVMVYNRPTIHVDAFENGRSDFICTNAVQYMIRDSRLHAIVQMRSNDAWAGYRNDFAWQKHVMMRLMEDLTDTYPMLLPGNITWQVGSLHIYERQFYLVENFMKTGKYNQSKEEIGLQLK